MSKLLLVALLTPLLPIALATADRGGHRAPPQEAFDACANHKQGDACSVTHDDHTMTGTCEAAPESSALACRPDHPPGPPPEAIAACRSAKAGDACAVDHDGHHITGTCDAGPDGNGPLACHPDGPPPPR